MAQTETKFTAAFMAEQRELAKNIIDLPWDAGDKSPEMYHEGDNSILAKNKDGDWLVLFKFNPNYDCRNESAYMIAAANHYPAALDEIERLRAENDRLRAANESQYAGLSDQVNALTMDRAMWKARAEWAAQDAERLAVVLKCQERAGACFCEPEDYDDLVKVHGAGRVEHSEYCKAAYAVLEDHAKLTKQEPAQP
jgi:hypothetical protein